VRIEKKEEGGRVTIDFFNKDDLRSLLDRIISNAVEEKILAEDKSQTDENDGSLYSVANFSI